MSNEQEARREGVVAWPMVAIGALTAYFLAYSTRVVLEATDAIERTPPTASHIPPLGLIVVALAWRSARLQGLRERVRTAWHRFTLAFALLVAGTVWQLACLRLDLPWGGWAHVLWFLYYPILLAGLYEVRSRSRSEAQRRRFWLDVTIVTAGGGMALLLLFAARFGAVFGTPEALLSIAYLAGDVGLLAGFASVFLRSRASRWQGWLPWLGAALLVEISGDSVYGIERVADAPNLDSLAHVLYAGAWVLRGVAAVRVATTLPDDTGSFRAARPQMHPLPYVAIVLGYAALAYAVFRRIEEIEGLLVATAALLTLLVLARQATSAGEVAELRTESAIREGEERFRSLVQNSSDVLMVVSAEGRIREATPSVERILGYTPEEVAGRLLESLVVGDQVAKLRHFLTQVLVTPGAHALIELALRRRDGSTIEMEPVAVNLLADRTVEGIVLTLRDISERRRLEQRLTHMAFHDPLTGLANRPFFAEQIAHARSRARRYNAKVAVLYVDLDDFKQINDEHGHAAGDHVLIELARRLAEASGGTDTAARLGGDEFAVLLEGLESGDEAEATAGRLLDLIAAPVVSFGREIPVAASIGIAEMGSDESDEDLLRHADLAMYHAKESGKGRFVRYAPSLDRESPRRRREVEMRNAIERGAFELHFQPVCRIADGRVIGAEALLRWPREESAFAMPGEFLDFAEETGLIGPIGDFVVDEACRFAAAWKERAGGRSSVGFNVSARQIADPRFVDVVTEAISRHGCAPRDLIVEVTESMAAGGRDEMLANLVRLREIGVRVAIDDFGAGYSSLQRLQELPVEVLKVDRSLVTALGTGAPPAVMRATVELARSLRLELVAEGVETAVQREILLALGCVWGQGFLWGPGLPQAAFLDRWAEAGTTPSEP